MRTLYFCPVVSSIFFPRLISAVAEWVSTILNILSLLWGTPSNFNRFRVLAALLQRRRSTEANQTLHDVWPSRGLVHYIYFFGGSCPPPPTEFCKVQNSLCVQVLALSCIGSVTVRHSSSGRQPNFAALSRGRHLYSAGRPSRWASAYILVCN